MYKKKSSTCNNNATTTVDNGTMTDNQNKETDSKTEIKNKEHVELVASFVERDENVQCLNVIVNCCACMVFGTTTHLCANSNQETLTIHKYNCIQNVNNANSSKIVYICVGNSNKTGHHHKYKNTQYM